MIDPSIALASIRQQSVLHILYTQYYLTMRTTALSSLVSGVTPFPSSSDDDCCSVTSTVDTTLPKAALVESSTNQNNIQKLSTRRRRVHFDLDHNESFHSHDDIHREDLWYSSTELKQFRVNFKSEAKAFRIIESEQQQQHDNDNDSSSSYAQVMERVYDTCCLYATEVSPPSVEAHDAQRLRAWVRVTDARWGLERLCVRSIVQDKMARRQDLYDIIVEDGADTSFLQQSMSAESLAEACRTISRGSRYFATLLGQAQACALDA